MYEYFKSIVDQDRCSVVICNTEHKIIYMNTAAVKKYSKYGGAALVGKSLLDCHNGESVSKIRDITAWFEKSKDNNIVFIYHNAKENRDVYMVALRNTDGALIGYYEKHEYRDRESAALYDLR